MSLHAHRQPRTPITLALIATVLCATLIAAPGCYRRVVKAKGLGADSVTVQDPYQESSALDNWIFGSSDSGPSKSTPLNR